MTELIGVLHLPDFIDPANDYLIGNYPELDSLLLELSPYFEGKIESIPDTIWGRCFFKEVALTQRERGASIICGDINRSTLFFESNWHLNHLYVRFKQKFIEPITNFRNKGLLKTIKEEHPEVAMLGASHCPYIKEMMPDAKYTLLLPKFEWFETEKDYLAVIKRAQPWKADKIIEVQG